MKRRHYPYIDQLAGHTDAPHKKNPFLDEVEQLAHAMSLTIIKMASNDPGSEQTAAYISQLEASIGLLKDKHFGGGLSEGGQQRMLLGQWSDER